MQYSKKLRLIVAATALTATTAATALPADSYAGSSVLSSGHWVKISVAESGIQQITHQQLSQWGFNDPSKVTVHGYGALGGYVDLLTAEKPDDLVNQPVVYTDDRILFYGEANARPSMVYTPYETRLPVPGIERNNYADAGYYFITDSTPVADVPQAGYVESEATPRPWHYCLQWYEDEHDIPYRAGQSYYGPDLTQSGNTFERTFPIVDRRTDSELVDTVVFRPILVAAGSDVSMDVVHSSLSSTYCSNIAMGGNGENEYFTTNATDMRRSLLRQSVRTSSFYLKITPAASSRGLKYAAVDNVALYYSRDNRMANNASLLMCERKVTGGDAFIFNNVASGTLAWDVSDGYAVRPLETRYNSSNSTMTFTAPADRELSQTVSAWRVIVFNPAKQHKAVSYFGEVTPQNIHAQEVPDLIIVTSKVCRSQAERLADIHREMLSHKVLVVDQDQVFNEFSSGAPSPWGIRRMVKMFYDRDNSKMRNLLLFGGGSFDNRGLTDLARPFKEAGALLITYGAWEYDYMRSKTRSYCSDGYFGVMSDDTTGISERQLPMDVNVGRITALNESKARTAVDKIHSYLANFPDVDISHRALIICDTGDDNVHMNSSENVAGLFQEYAPGSTTVKAYNALYPWDGIDAASLRASIAQALKMGTGFVSYNGHANPAQFSTYNIWNLQMTANTDYSFYPFAIFATCDSYGYDRLTPNVTEEMIFKNHGGMIGVIGSTRTVYQKRNVVLNEAVAQAYAQANATTLTGDVYRNARNMVVNDYASDMDMLVNTACYSLCGDPAIPVYAANTLMGVSQVNGVDYSDSDTYELSPLTANTLSGYIVKDEKTGEIDTSFNGYALLTLYEAPETRKSLQRITGEISAMIDTDEDVLGQYKAQVVDGRFTISFTPPIQSRQGAYNRITLLAVNDNIEGTYPTIVKSHITNAVLNASLAPEASADTEGPVISSLYIDKPSFVSGDVVSGEFTVYAVVEPDPSGIHTTTGNVGGNARLIIDGSRTLPIIGTAMSIDAEGRVSLNCPVSNINDGRHELTVTVSDNAANYNSRSIEFIVINEPASASLALEEKVAREQATLKLSHTFAANPGGRLIIEDSKGNTVYTSQASGESGFGDTISWDLYDKDLHLVADGVYYAYAILNSGLQYATTPKCEILVIQKQ